jgi:hypothetical protein
MDGRTAGHPSIRIWERPTLSMSNKENRVSFELDLEKMPKAHILSGSLKFIAVVLFIALLWAAWKSWVGTAAILFLLLIVALAAACRAERAVTWSEFH